MKVYSYLDWILRIYKGESEEEEIEVEILQQTSCPLRFSEVYLHMCISHILSLKVKYWSGKDTFVNLSFQIF